MTALQAGESAVPRHLAATTQRRRRKTQKWLLIGMVGPALVYVCLFFAYPLVLDIIMSFQKYDFRAIIRGHGPFVGFANYRYVFTDGVTSRAIVNTAVFTVGSIFFQFVIGFAMALYFNQNFTGSGFLRRLILIPWVMPLVAVGTMFQLVFQTQNGLANELLKAAGIVHTNVSWLSTGTLAVAAIVIGNIWAGVPFNAILLYSGLQEVPKDLLEAAAMDGAGRWRRLTNVIVPSMRNVILIVLMLGIVYTVKTFDLVIVLTGGGPANESHLLSSWSYTQAFTNFQFGYGTAIGNVLLVFCLIVGVIYLRMSRESGSVGGTI